MGDRGRALFVAGGVGMIGFSLAFALPAYAPVRVLWYYPLARRWEFATEAVGLAMDWYGRGLLSVAIAVVATALAYPAVRALDRRRALGAGAATMVTAWALSATLIVMAFFAWNLARRVPRPEPLPPGYQAR